MIVHLIDGTYELFRHFYGFKRVEAARPAAWRRRRRARARSCRCSKDGATHIGVATDHVIESFRNELWPGYKTGEGIDPALWAQFHPLEEALVAMGVDDVADGRARGRRRARVGRASGGRRPARSRRCASGRRTRISRSASSGDRVVQMDRRSGEMRDAARVRAKFGVDPALIPDYLALVGDAADGYPGHSGHRRRRPPRASSTNTAISNSFPPNVLRENRERALLFKTLATLRTDAPLFADVEELRWNGASDAFAAVAAKMDDTRLAERVRTLGFRNI